MWLIKSTKQSSGSMQCLTICVKHNYINTQCYSCNKTALHVLQGTIKTALQFESTGNIRFYLFFIVFHFIFFIKMTEQFIHWKILPGHCT